MILDSGQSYAGRAYRDAMMAAHSHGVPVVLVRRGMRWTSGDGVTLDVLAPSMPFLADTGDDVNENSIVVMIRYRNYRELFMGDAGEASESRLLAPNTPCHPERSRGAAEDMAGGDPSTSLGMTCEDDLHRRQRSSPPFTLTSQLSRSAGTTALAIRLLQRSKHGAMPVRASSAPTNAERFRLRSDRRRRQCCNVHRRKPCHRRHKCVNPAQAPLTESPSWNRARSGTR